MKGGRERGREGGKEGRWEGGEDRIKEKEIKEEREGEEN